MTAEMDTRPLLDEPGAPDELRSLLAFARSDGPSAADLERFSQRLAPALGLAATALGTPEMATGTAPANPAPMAPAPASAVGQGAFGKLAFSSFAKLVAASCLVGAGLWWWAAAPQPDAAAPIVSRPSAPVPSAPQAPELPPNEQVTAPAQLPALEAAQPTREVKAKPARLALPRTQVSAPVEQPSELALIKQAQALRGQSSELLEVLALHARLYPKGALAQEREVLAIEALVAAGKRDEAGVRARSLEAAYPGSAHLRRVRVLLGEAGTE